MTIETTMTNYRGDEFPALAKIVYCGIEFVDACHFDHSIACEVIAETDEKAEAAIAALARSGYPIERSNDPDSARTFRTPALGLLGFMQVDGVKFGTSRDNDVKSFYVPEVAA